MATWAIGQSKWLFAGSPRAGQRAAAITSLTRSAQFNGHAPLRFKRVVEPDEQLILNVTFERYMRGISKFKAHSQVNGRVASEAELMCTVKNTGVVLK